MDPLETLMVGDMVGDIHAAKENRVSSIALSYGFGTLQDMEATGADYLAHSVSELREILLPLLREGEGVGRVFPPDLRYRRHLDGFSALCHQGLSEACSAMGLEPNREAFLVHAGIRTALVLREYYRLNEEEFQKASAIYGAAFHRDSHTARPFPRHPRAAFPSKRGGVQMCVATARTQDALDALFGSRGIWDYFSYFGCSTSRQERPNKADSIRRCAQHMGVPPGTMPDDWGPVCGYPRRSGGGRHGLWNYLRVWQPSGTGSGGPQYLVDSVEELSGLLFRRKIDETPVYYL